MFEIFCDSLQEGIWFKNLHSALEDSEFVVIPNRKSEQRAYGIDKVLVYDRPDIILKHADQVIFVLERTVEVPSGHNVGQRFGRLVAAAKQRIPVVYFGPYMAYKHGGDTAGPRYMNLRLFYSLKNVSQHYNTAITTINWPVDSQCEVLKTPEKDFRIKQYMRLLFEYYCQHGMDGLTEYIMESQFQAEQYDEQEQFAQNEIRNPEQYDVPPASVELLSVRQFRESYYSGVFIPGSEPIQRIVLYHVGMTYIRSDPYVGMATLYYFLYRSPGSIQILHFPHITSRMWYEQDRKTKTYRIFKEFCDMILFSDRLIPQEEL